MTFEELIETLRNAPLLHAATPEVLAGLANAAIERQFEASQVFIEEGSVARIMYLIVDGLVEVYKGQGDDRVFLNLVKPGELVGEMGLLDGSPRFANVRALEPTRVLEFSEENLRSVWLQQPELLYQLVLMLTHRLRDADLHMIADLQRKNIELARAYKDLKQAQAALVEKERLERELELAYEIQTSILPQELPQLPGFRCATRYRPARQVGGDFYDVIDLGDHRLGLVMADVSDKGMPAALFMALTRSLIRAEARRSNSPREVLMSIHQLLMEISQSGMFVTVFYGVLDLNTYQLVYARAGHDRPILLRSGTEECRVLDARGMALGMLDWIVLDEIQVEVHPGDALVLYTDGITEASSPSSEIFGLERLLAVVCRENWDDPRVLCDEIFTQVEKFQSTSTQYDDMALMVAWLTED